MKKRKPLSHNAYLKKLNQEMQEHPNYQKGMRVDKIEANLYYMTPPEDLNADNAEDINKFSKDRDLQMVLWDSIAVIDKTYSYTDKRVSEKRLLNSTLYRNSKEGRGSVQIQSRLKSIYDCIIAYKQECGSWPADVAPLIEKLKIRDPWDKKENLRVQYIAPANDSDHQQVLAEYTREGKRKFALYVDGHQETWKV
jgi:hypothetical protein